MPGFPDRYALQSPKDVVDNEPDDDKDCDEVDRAPERGCGEDATVK